MTAAPRAIGRYEVERLLGMGGMGCVWLAHDSVLGRRVAVKVLRDDLALPPRVRDELLERMRHEARAAAAVSHPNIVTLHDMGEDADVGLYLVFEFVPGPTEGGADPNAAPQTLRERLRSGPLPLGDVARLARELGSALTFAHEAGVIHRDVKPENVLFSRTGAKIADFGIARIPESTITRANTVLGTPAYTAPEALSHGTFGPASDQFSLAATLYEAATAQSAFGADDPLTTAGRVSNDPPAQLPAELGPPAVVRALGDALARGLAKTPEARFASCAELGEAVARAVEAAPARPNLARIDLPAGRIEIERTPLSSRVALVDKTVRISELPLVPDLRPSVMIRKRTHRAQNILVAIALLVIAALAAFGRKPPAAPAEEPAAQAPAARSVTSAPPLAAKAPTRIPHPKIPASSTGLRPAASTSAEPHATADGDASAAPDVSHDE